jgi:hypothetical protein
MKSTASVVFSHPPSLSGLTSVPQTKDTLTKDSNCLTMQPPVITAHIRNSVNRLITESKVSKTQEHTNSITVSIPDNYVGQITKWSEHLSAAQLSRKYSIEEVIVLARLRGRYRDQASVRYTGEALRRCGFITKRDWTVAGRNKRYWIKGSL